MGDSPHPLGLGKPCANCGARSNTLGGICPACRRPYDPDTLMLGGAFAAPTLTLVALAALVGIVWLLVTNPVAGIALTGAAFLVLVAAVGAANALAGRGRQS